MSVKEKIKVGYDSQTKMYVFKTISNPTMEVNGKSVSSPVNGFISNYLVTTSEKPETITYKTKTNPVIGYINNQTGERITVDEYMLQNSLINETRTYNDETDEWEYNTIEDEVNAIKFSRSFQSIFGAIETVHELEIEIIEYPVSEYKDIEPLHTLDGKNVFETKCQYTPSNRLLFYDVCADYGIDKSRITVSNHSGISYVKIDGSYLSGSEDVERRINGSLIGTYEECVNRLKRNRKMLDDLVSTHIAKNSQKILDKVTVGGLMKELLIIKNNISNLDVKQKDINHKRGLMNKLNELIETYKQFA